MEVKVNIIDTLFTTIPKDTVVANYTIDEQNVDLKMLNSLYYFDEANKTILTAKNINSNNLEAINFTVRNWVTAEQIEINDKYPKVIAKVQNKFNKPNVIYKITKDYDLNHCILTIPEGCTLQFDGGAISNGSLSGNFTKIIADSSTVIFGQQIHIEGSWNIADIYDEWFWFDTDPSYISNDTIKNILALSNDSINNTIHFDASRTYYFELPYKGRANLGDDIRPDYWKLNTPDYDFLRIFTGVTSNTHLIVNNTLQMLPTNQGAYFIFQIENKENIEISGTGTINGDAKDHLYTDPFAGTLYYGEWGHILNFRSCDNIVIRDITVGYAFGDGIALGNAAYNTNGVKSCNPATKNVLIDGVKVLYARRNGISLGGNNYSITNVYFEGCGSDEIKGTAPMAAIDFENDYIDIDPSGICSNVVMSSCKFKDNKYDASSTIRDDLATIPAGELVVINDCNFTAPLRLNRTHGLTFNNCHIVGISSHDNSISAWYSSSDLIFNCCVFDELNPYLAISAEEQGKKFVNPTYPEDIKYSTTFQHSLSSTKALKFTIPKPLVGLVEFTAFCSNPNYSAVQMPINTTEYTFGNSQRLTGIRDVKVRTTQDSTPRYAMYKNTPVFSYINYAEDADNFIIYFAIGGQILGDPLAGNTSVNIFVTSKTKFTVVEAPVSGNPNYAGIYGGKWSELSAIKKQSIDFTSIPSTVTFPSKEIYPASTMADLPTSLTPDKVNKSFFLLDSSYRLPAFWDSYDNTFRDADGNKILGRTVGLKADLDALAAKLTTSDRGYKVYYNSYATNLTWSGTEWLNVDGSRYETTRIIRDKASTLTWSQVLGFKNLTYIIVGDIDLGGEELVLGNNTILDFQGGSFSNGSIVFQNTEIKGAINKINCTVTGSVKGDVILDYFGVSELNTAEVNTTNYNNINLSNETYIFLEGVHNFSTSIVPKGKVFKGSGPDTVLKFNSSGGLEFPTHAGELINRYIGNFTIIADGNCIDLMISDSSGVDGVNYSQFDNMIIQSLNGDCFHSTIRNNYTYANKFTNLLLIAPNGNAFNNCSLILTTILDRVDTQGKMNAFFNNCAFKNTQMSNCNIGWGGNYGYLIYNDTGRGAMSSLLYSIRMSNCNFEEGITNAITNIYNSNNEDFVAFSIIFDKSSIIYNNTLLGKSVYAWSGDSLNKITLADQQAYFSCIIGYNIIFRANDSIISYPSFIANRTLRVSMVSFNRDYLASWGFPGFSDDMPHTGTINLSDGVGHRYWKNEHNCDYLPTLDEARRGMYVKYGPQGWLWDGVKWVQLTSQVGLTNARPTLDADKIGYLYFDTSLNKYICWNGIKWTNLDGTALS